MTRYICENKHAIQNQFVNGYCTFSTECRFILLVEKETVFERLVGSGFSSAMNCIIMTGQGYPSLTCRRFLSLLSSSTKLPIYGLFDFNPDGLSILLTYQLGSLSLAMEAYQ